MWRLYAVLIVLIKLFGEIDLSRVVRIEDLKDTLEKSSAFDSTNHFNLQSGYNEVDSNLENDKNSIPFHDIFDKLNEFKSLTPEKVNNPKFPDSIGDLIGRDKVDDEGGESMYEDTDDDESFKAKLDLVSNLMADPNIKEYQVQQLMLDLNMSDDPSADYFGKDSEYAMDDYNDDIMMDAFEDDFSNKKSYRKDEDNKMSNDMENAKSKALEYLSKVQKEGRCLHPKPKLIPVKRHYPYSHKMFLPHCVILHQCADDTGCCLTAERTCQPVAVEKVEIPVYAFILGGENVVERLIFFNHTKCECRKQTEMDMEPAKAIKTFSVETFEARTTTKPSLSIKRCECPKAFSAVILSEGECKCDCIDRHQACLQLKRGKEHFGLKDRRCMHRNICTEPKCEFGTYNKSEGKCPSKKEVS